MSENVLEGINWIFGAVYDKKHPTPTLAAFRAEVEKQQHENTASMREDAEGADILPPDFTCLDAPVPQHASVGIYYRLMYAGDKKGPFKGAFSMINATLDFDLGPAPQRLR